MLYECRLMVEFTTIASILIAEGFTFTRARSLLEMHGETVTHRLEVRDSV